LSHALSRANGCTHSIRSRFSTDRSGYFAGGCFSNNNVPPPPRVADLMSAYLAGTNTRRVSRALKLRDEQFAEAAATLAKSAPDVIFCTGNPAMRAARESTTKTRQM
jgi:hypothetical protein